jgi:phage gpG-like protein
MARLNFKIEVEGQAAFNRGFNEVTETISDLTPIWKPVQREFHKIEREQFESEGSKGASGQWQQLSQPYEQIKLEKYGSKPILEATGRLKRSLTEENSDSIAEFGRQDAAFGTSVPYGRFHQKGNDRLPARAVISLSDRQKERLARAMRREIVSLLKRSALKIE